MVSLANSGRSVMLNAHVAVATFAASYSELCGPSLPGAPL